MESIVLSVSRTISQLQVTLSPVSAPCPVSQALKMASLPRIGLVLKRFAIAL